MWWDAMAETDGGTYGAESVGLNEEESLSEIGVVG